MEWIATILLPVIALAGGILIGKTLAKSQQKSDRAALDEKLNASQAQLQMLAEQRASDRQMYEKQLQQIQSELETLRNEKQTLAIKLAQKETAFENLWEKNLEQKQEVEKLQEKFTKEFENLANRIMEEKSVRFTETNKETHKNILTQLQEKIQLFEKKVEDTHKESIDYHAALREHIQNIKLMNETMTRETMNLTKALKGDSKLQGNWGELVLERVLAKSGLEKGREYEVQQSFTTAEGTRVLPDVIINLPDGKKMIVDSKVSLTAYERYCNEEDDSLKPSH